MSTAADANGLSRRFRITHRFHPWSGQEFELVTYLHTWGENRVYFHEGRRASGVGSGELDGSRSGRPAGVPGSGAFAIRAVDLIELAQLVERLTLGERKGNYAMTVKVMLSYASVKDG